MSIMPHNVGGDCAHFSLRHLHQIGVQIKGYMFSKFKIILAVTTLSSLVACGGGGGGGSTAPTGPVASTNTFNIKSGYSALVSAGYNKTFTLSGSCTGSFVINQGAASTSTTFNGSPSVSGTRLSTITLSNCTPALISETSTNYYDSSYSPLGYAYQGGNYAKYATPVTIPTAAKVGDVVILGTISLFTDAAFTIPNGHVDETYVMEADTATTAIINITDKTYNTSNVLTSTEQDRYKVAADGTLTPYSLDVQYANGSTTHLIGN